uniref:Uncharacterized protein n=1 Tax=Romanomermis culicivorax TaxID=13658 RepID=A0A915JF28_ROMCU
MGLGYLTPCYTSKASAGRRRPSLVANFCCYTSSGVGLSIGRLSFMNDLQEQGTRRTSEPEMENRRDLEWNPVDGMHAERQRDVSTLKNLFEHRRHRSAKK